jgi:hypothetical protein
MRIFRAKACESFQYIRLNLRLARFMLIENGHTPCFCFTSFRSGAMRLTHGTNEATMVYANQWNGQSCSNIALCCLLSLSFQTRCSAVCASFFWLRFFSMRHPSLLSQLLPPMIRYCSILLANSIVRGEWVSRNRVPAKTRINTYLYTYKFRFYVLCTCLIFGTLARVKFPNAEKMKVFARQINGNEPESIILLVSCMVLCLHLHLTAHWSLWSRI